LVTSVSGLDTHSISTLDPAPDILNVKNQCSAGIPLVFLTLKDRSLIMAHHEDVEALSGAVQALFLSSVGSF
jgi:hypothetical protein